MSTQSHRLFVALALFGLVFSPARASAQQTFDLTLEVVTPTPTCSVTVDDVDFGQVDTGEQLVPLSNLTPFDLNFTCTAAVAVATATFDDGLNFVSGIRRLADGNGNDLMYILERHLADAAWAGGPLDLTLPSGSSSVELVASLVTQTAPAAAGTYTDQVTVTFTF